MPQGCATPDKRHLAQERSGKGGLEEVIPELEGSKGGRKRSWQGMPSKENMCTIGQMGMCVCRGMAWQGRVTSARDGSIWLGRAFSELFPALTAALCCLQLSLRTEVDLGWEPWLPGSVFQRLLGPPMPDT